ncbi:expressed unknown protein [Seminavis robusta]|uniref:Uncharacterized protein n=1 Tax=Seminavis robusta TaxID=568900 RepID=A0A9N8EKK8_9STRA|nr:expressed unknown protein [Seminavis robusta]|eukprot:Sro1264_g257330.1 n/a (164) ;mRNA; r:9278-9769
MSIVGHESVKVVDDENRRQKHKLKKLKVQPSDSFLDNNSGFIPPSKLAKMNKTKQGQKLHSSDSSIVSSTRSQRTTATRTGSGSSSNSSSMRSSTGSYKMPVRHHCKHGHDDCGRCRRTCEDEVAPRRPRRVIGVKPPRCDTAGDGLFRSKSGGKMLGRSYTR